MGLSVLLATIFVVANLPKAPTLAVNGKNYRFYKSIEMWGNVRFFEFTRDSQVVVVKVLLEHGTTGSRVAWHDTVKASEFAPGEFDKFVELARERSPHATKTPCGIYVREDL